jgi:hypothetical protein
MKNFILMALVLGNFVVFCQVTKTKAKQSTTSKPSTYTPKKAPVTSTTTKPATRPTPTKPAVVAEKPKPATNYKPVAKPAISYRGGYHHNDKLLNIGIGLNSYYYGNPIGLSYEVGSYPNVSIGGQFDFNSSKDNRLNGYNYGYNAYYVGARGSYHVNEILKIRDEKIDLYVGVGLGYQGIRYKDRTYVSNYGSGLFFNYFVGGKYYFSGKIGAFVEVGYTGLSRSRIGVSLKL